MPKIKYQNVNFTRARLAVIAKANEIIASYQAQGYDLTLRQLYYQFVSRDLIPNKQSEYKKLGDAINEGRLGGLIDWDAIVDRTRSLRSLSSWENPAEIVEGCSRGFRVDMWANQTYRPEVWIEKDALVGVIEGVCEELRVPFFSCRGYTSQSEMWSAGQRLQSYSEGGQTPIIFHLGDHDPSGKDMTRDICDRLEMFMGGLKVDRLALNYDQVERYNPPPNPTKIDDSRSTAYIAEFGMECWELDALEPRVMTQLVRDAILDVRDEKAWKLDATREREDRASLADIADRYDEVQTYLLRDNEA